MELGFIGAGSITAAIVHGLGAGFAAEGRIHLSPRNAGVASALADRFAHVQVAASNQAVLDACGTVVLAVRPQDAAAVLPALRFRAEHHVISLIATLSAATLAGMIAPAVHLTQAVPLPSVAIGQGPTAIFPPDPAASALFGRMGIAIGVDRPDAFAALTAATATIASHAAFIATVAGWLARHGVSAAEADRFVTLMFNGLFATAARSGTPDFASLAKDHATPGGINEELARRLTGSGAFASLEAALDAILARIKASHVD